MRADLRPGVRTGQAVPSLRIAVPSRKRGARRCDPGPAPGLRDRPRGWSLRRASQEPRNRGCWITPHCFHVHTTTLWNLRKAESRPNMASHQTLHGSDSPSSPKTMGWKRQLRIRSQLSRLAYPMENCYLPVSLFGLCHPHRLLAKALFCMVLWRHYSTCTRPLSCSPSTNHPELRFRASLTDDGSRRVTLSKA